MRAVVYAGQGAVEVRDVPEPVIAAPDDVIVRVAASAICGSDLHILAGRIPGMVPGGILGHEFVGEIIAVGSGVERWRIGDRVLASFTIPCGACWYCHRQEFSRCEDQWVFGYGSLFGDVSGSQAEAVRVPRADRCLRAVPSALTTEQSLLVGDVVSSAVEAATRAALGTGDTVAVIGCGPVGLMTVQVLASAHPGRVFALDSNPGRLQRSEAFGATPVDVTAVHAPSFIQDHTDGRGADVVVECVGRASALLTALDAVRPGGRVVVVGVHTDQELALPLNLTFIRGIDLMFCGTANVVEHWDRAVDLIEAGAIDPTAVISHRLPLDSAAQGYAAFGRGDALKVVLTP